jgi:hypothetical protein
VLVHSSSSQTVVVVILETRQLPILPSSTVAVDLQVTWTLESSAAAEPLMEAHDCVHEIPIAAFFTSCMIFTSDHAGLSMTLPVIRSC